MPRVQSETAALIADLQARIAQLVAAARLEGHDAALANIRSIVSGGGAIPEIGSVRRGPGRPRGSKNKPAADAAARSAKKRTSSWAGLTAAEHLERVNAIRKGKGLPPRTE
jgi:hypothetical protein